MADVPVRPSARASGGQTVLIANADDFGLSPGVNAGVVEAFQRGIVRSASLMVNAPYASQAARTAAEVGLDLGLHLNLTTGRPIRAPKEVASLVSAGGRFHSLPVLLLRLATGRLNPTHLHRELDAQIEAARALGVRPSHLNGHHHVHVFPVVATTVLRLASHHGLPVRTPLEPPLSVRPRDLARVAIISPFGLRLQRQARHAAASSTHAFRGISLGYGFGPQSLAKTLRALPAGVTELMCHPGYPDAELARTSMYSAGRERELAALTDPSIRRLAGELGIVLASWEQAFPR